MRRLGIVIALGFAFAGCGGGGESAQPKLPRQLALAWAQRSDEIAALLDRHDSCRALRAAEALQQQTIQAINTHLVPPVYQEPLQSKVNQLVADIKCTPPPKQEEHGKGRHKGKGKHKEGGD